MSNHNYFLLSGVICTSLVTGCLTPQNSTILKIDQEKVSGTVSNSINSESFQSFDQIKDKGPFEIDPSSLNKLLSEDEIKGAGTERTSLTNETVPSGIKFGPYLLVKAYSRKLYKFNYSASARSRGKILPATWRYMNGKWTGPFVLPNEQYIRETDNAWYLMAFISDTGGTVTSTYEELPVTAGNGGLILEWASLAESSGLKASPSQITEVNTTITGVNSNYRFSKTYRLLNPSKQVGARIAIPNIAAGLVKLKLEFKNASGKVVYTLINNRLGIVNKRITAARVRLDARQGQKINGKLQLIHGNLVNNISLESSFGGSQSVRFKDLQAFKKTINANFGMAIQQFNQSLFNLPLGNNDELSDLGIDVSQMTGFPSAFIPEKNIFDGIMNDKSTQAPPTFESENPFIQLDLPIDINDDKTTTMEIETSQNEQDVELGSSNQVTTVETLKVDINGAKKPLLNSEVQSISIEDGSVAKLVNSGPTELPKIQHLNPGTTTLNILDIEGNHIQETIMTSPQKTNESGNGFVFKENAPQKAYGPPTENISDRWWVALKLTATQVNNHQFKLRVTKDSLSELNRIGNTRFESGGTYEVYMDGKPVVNAVGLKYNQGQEAIEVTLDAQVIGMRRNDPTAFVVRLLPSTGWQLDTIGALAVTWK